MAERKQGIGLPLRRPIYLTFPVKFHKAIIIRRRIDPSVGVRHDANLNAMTESQDSQLFKLLGLFKRFGRETYLVGDAARKDRVDPAGPQFVHCQFDCVER